MQDTRRRKQDTRDTDGARQEPTPSAARVRNPSMAWELPAQAAPPTQHDLPKDIALRSAPFCYDLASLTRRALFHALSIPSAPVSASSLATVDGRNPPFWRAHKFRTADLFRERLGVFADVLG